MSELSKQELGCGMFIMFVLLVGILLWWAFSDDNPEPRYTPVAPVEEKQATNNEILEAIKKLERYR